MSKEHEDRDPDSNIDQEDSASSHEPESGDEDGQAEVPLESLEPDSGPEGEDAAGAEERWRPSLPEDDLDLEEAESLRRSQVAALLGQDVPEDPNRLGNGPGEADMPVVGPDDVGLDADPADLPADVPVELEPPIPMGRKPAETPDQATLDDLAAAREAAAGAIASAAPIAAGAVASTETTDADPGTLGDLRPREAGWLRLGLLFVAALGLAVWLALAAAHVNDRYAVNTVAGSWIALTKWADEGTLYPARFDADTGTYGGTRYMPATIILNLGAAKITGEYLRSAKIVAYGCAALMLLTTLWILLRRRCPPTLAMGMVGLIVLSPAGLQAATSIRGDALPVFLQLLALGLFGWKGRQSVPAAVIVGVLGALAIFSKMTALWGIGAIGIWLLIENRRQLIFVAAGCFATLVIGGGVMWLTTGGRFFTETMPLAFAGSEALRPIITWAPPRLLGFMTGWAPACWALVPLSLLGLMVVVTRRQVTPYHIALIVLLPILLVIFADVGVGENHVLDLLVLSAIVVGDLAGRLPRPKRGMALTHAMLASIVIVAGLLLLLHNPRTEDIDDVVPGRDAIQALEMLVGRDIEKNFDARPLEGIIAADASVLSEDPYVPVSLGQVPVLLDGFMLKRMDADGEAVQALIGRLDDRAFDHVVLLHELDIDSWWYDRLIFGRPITEAIARNYALQQIVNGYYIYVPVASSPDASS